MIPVFDLGSPVLIAFNADASLEPCGDDDEPPSLLANEDVARVAQHIAHTLSSLGVQASLLPLVDDLEPLRASLDTTPVTPIVFNLVESLGGDASREAELPELLASRGVPFTGNSADVLRRALDKARVRSLLHRQGIAVARGVIAPSPSIALREVRRAALRFPLFVKPACCDASIGISQDSVVYDDLALARQVKRLAHIGDGRSIIEEYLPGPEINVSIWPDPRSGHCAATMIDFSAFGPHLHPIVSYDCKWNDQSEEYQARTALASDHLPQETIQNACLLAKKALVALGIDSYARVDLRLASDGLPRVLDINANPDLDAQSGLAIAAQSQGFDYPSLLLHILQHDLKVSRHAPPRPARHSRRSRSTHRHALAHP